MELNNIIRQKVTLNGNNNSVGEPIPKALIKTWAVGCEYIFSGLDSTAMNGITDEMLIASIKETKVINTSSKKKYILFLLEK
jgi:hypothetical protein